MLETTEDIEEIENKIGGGQIEEMIFLHEREVEFLPNAIKSDIWRRQEKYHAVPFVVVPSPKVTDKYSHTGESPTKIPMV